MILAKKCRTDIVDFPYIYWYNTKYRYKKYFWIFNGVLTALICWRAFGFALLYINHQTDGGSGNARHSKENSI